MDVIIATVAGLAFRLYLNNLDGPLTPAFLGLCEGALVRYLPIQSSSLDHYLACGLRIVVDLFFTENITRMILVILWTAITVIASDTLSPISHKRSRRYIVAHTHTPQPRHLTTPSPLNPPLPSTPLPHLSPNMIPTQMTHDQPPSLPSLFLDGESETNVVSPTSEQQLQYSPESDSRSRSSSPRPMLLPTPPAMLGTDTQESDTMSHHRLSTIQELSGDESGNLDKPDSWTEADHARPHLVFDKPTPSYAPSVTTSVPILPVPNTTYIRADRARTGVLDNDDPLRSPSSPSAPLPVPNAAIRSQQSEWKIDTASEPDELRTPGAHHWELTDRDELRTPTAHQKALSPLFSDRQLPASFGATGDVQSTEDDIAPLPIPIVGPGASNLPSSNLLNSSVECFPKVVNDQIPDLDQLSEAETLPTETEATSVISPGNSKALFSRGEFFRQEAWKEEKRRSLLDGELKAALKETRIRDTLFLREDIRVLEARVNKLHEKAARRFIKGKYTSRPSIKG